MARRARMVIKNRRNRAKVAEVAKPEVKVKAVRELRRRYPRRKTTMEPETFVRPDWHKFVYGGVRRPRYKRTRIPVAARWSLRMDNGDYSSR